MQTIYFQKRCMSNVFYHPPDNVNSVQNFEESLFKVRSDCKIIIIGDMNINWLFKSQTSQVNEHLSTTAWTIGKFLRNQPAHSRWDPHGGVDTQPGLGFLSCRNEERWSMGDELILIAASNLFNIEITIISCPVNPNQNTLSLPSTQLLKRKKNISIY